MIMLYTFLGQNAAMEEESSQKRRLRELRLLVDEEGNEPTEVKSVVSELECLLRSEAVTGWNTSFT